MKWIRHASFIVALITIAVLSQISMIPGTETSAQKEIPSIKEFGLTKATSINVCAPKGQRAYLERLRCPDDRAPSYTRGGSVGPRFDAKTEEERAAWTRQMMNFDSLKKGEKDFHM
ncbi:MAG: hypothetical protein V3U39_12135, partial [Acidimicrobiia bacterium]